jgi:hypothetical protein
MHQLYNLYYIIIIIDASRWPIYNLISNDARSHEYKMRSLIRHFVTDAAKRH